jgi:hypothetical protein
MKFHKVASMSDLFNLCSQFCLIFVLFNPVNCTRNQIYLVVIVILLHISALVGHLDQRKQAKMHWLQDLNQSNVDNWNYVRHEASRYFRVKKKEYLEAKIY